MAIAPHRRKGDTFVMNDDRLFPADPTTRGIARRLFRAVRELPIISPHGHTDPRWYAENEPFPDPARCSSRPTTT